MAIEDPFSLKQSLSRNLLTQTNKYIINVFSKSCLYFVANTHNYTDVEATAAAREFKEFKEEKCKIVDKLVAETGILDAKKTNSELDEDYDDLEGEGDVEHAENGDDAAQVGDSVDDDEDDLFYFNKTKKTKEKSTSSKRSSKKSTSESSAMNKLSKEVDALSLKLKSISDELLEPVPLKSTENNSSSMSTTPVQENESDEMEPEEELNVDDEDSEKFTQEDDDDEEENDDDENNEDSDTDSDVYDENNDELFFENDALQQQQQHQQNHYSAEIKSDIRHSVSSKHSEYEQAAKNCLNCLIKRVVEMNESFYEQMPSVALRTISNLSGSRTVNSQKGKSQQHAAGFRFSASSLGFAKSPPLICSLCNKDGHLQSECPQDRLPKLEELPKMTDHWKEVLDKVCLCIMGNAIFKILT